LFGPLVHVAATGKVISKMAIAVAVDFMRTDLALADATFDRQADRSECKIAKVVHRLLLDHSIDRTFDMQDDLRDVGLTSLDMASLVLSVEPNSIS
jgi:hypothetical protein